MDIYTADSFGELLLICHCPIISYYLHQGHYVIADGGIFVSVMNEFQFNFPEMLMDQATADF